MKSHSLPTILLNPPTSGKQGDMVTRLPKADWQLKTPVALFIFNRPDMTARVFESIRQAKPSKLMVVADGPRADCPGEAEKCAAARAVIERLDWECELLKNYADLNLGCKRRMSSGLDWVFRTVDAAIILEDDCIPHPTFFRFCSELLAKYQDDERIMAISGDNFQFGQRRTEDSYYFSRYSHSWGWASWRRAWQHYDVEMKLWPKIRDGDWLKDLLLDPHVVKYWTEIFQVTYEGHINTWDYQWLFACWMQSGLAILPNVNLVSNIGFGAEATHTTSDSPLADMPMAAMRFPLQHPSFVLRDTQADDFTQNVIYDQSIGDELLCFTPDIRFANGQWYDCEKTFRWSRPTFECPFFLKEQKRYIEIHWASLRQEQVDVKISINDDVSLMLQIREPEWRIDRISLPEALTGIVWLKVGVLNPFLPAGDPRELGMAFQSIRFVPR